MILKLQNGDKVKIDGNEKKQDREKFKEYSKLSIKLKLKRNLNIASSFINEGPNITNIGNAISALFGGYSPENPDLHYGEAPGAGIKNFANLVRTARVAREFNNVLSVSPKAKLISRNSDSRKPIFIPEYGREMSYETYLKRLYNIFKNRGYNVSNYNRSEVKENTLMNFFNRGFTPVFKMSPGENLQAHALEILRRMRNFGMDVDNTKGYLPGYGNRSVKDLVTLNSGRNSYVGYYSEPGYGGSYFWDTGTSILDPGPTYRDIDALKSIVSSMHHERNMHGTDRLLSPLMWKPYEDFISKMFPKITIDADRNRSVVLPDGKIAKLETKGSELKEEVRATIGEIRKNLYDTRAHKAAKVDHPDVKMSDLETKRPYFEKEVDNITNEDMKLMLDEVNGYGFDYQRIGPVASNTFFDDLKTLLKIAPATIPFLIPGKEEKK